MADSDFLRILAGIAFRRRCRIKGLCLRSSARRLPRPLAPATAGVFRSCRRTPKPSPRVAHPLEPSPLMGRGVSGAPSSLPLEGKVPPKGADEVSPRSGVKRPRPARSQSRGYFAPRRKRFFCLRRPHSSNSGRNGGKNAGRNCVSALPQRAMPVRCRLRFPSRNRRFPDRCRSPNCASTAFRCRCLLLRQKLFVLPCRRLRNNYIRAQRAHLPLPPQGGKGAI